MFKQELKTKTTVITCTFLEWPNTETATPETWEMPTNTIEITQSAYFRLCSAVNFTSLIYLFFVLSAVKTIDGGKVTI